MEALRNIVIVTQTNHDILNMSNAGLRHWFRHTSVPQEGGVLNPREHVLVQLYYN